MKYSYTIYLGQGISYSKHAWVEMGPSGGDFLPGGPGVEDASVTKNLKLPSIDCIGLLNP
jgi:hypothetical protein